MLKSNYEIYLNNFAKNLKEKRLEKNITQKELGQILGYKDQQTIFSYENGEKKPTIENLIKLSEIFDCTPNELLGITEQRKKISYLDLIRYIEQLELYKLIRTHSYSETLLYPDPEKPIEVNHLTIDVLDKTLINYFCKRDNAYEKLSEDGFQDFLEIYIDKLVTELKDMYPDIY